MLFQRCIIIGIIHAEVIFYVFCVVNHFYGLVEAFELVAVQHDFDTLIVVIIAACEHELFFESFDFYRHAINRLSYFSSLCSLRRSACWISRYCLCPRICVVLLRLLSLRFCRFCSDAGVSFGPIRPFCILLFFLCSGLWVSCST